ncbi:hypothetical protein RQP46_006133 [Phenoliferia psychrophenolica]
MSPPYIPTELITDIIELTVELLIEEERHLPSHTPLSNHFLLSTALVNRTWNAIATPVLLKNGVVTSDVRIEFVARVKAHGMEGTLARLRYGDKPSGGVAEGNPALEDAAFDYLVHSLPGLIEIELVGSGAYFQTPESHSSVS